MHEQLRTMVKFHNSDLWIAWVVLIFMEGKSRGWWENLVVYSFWPHMVPQSLLSHYYCRFNHYSTIPQPLSIRIIAITTTKNNNNDDNDNNDHSHKNELGYMDNKIKWHKYFLSRVLIIHKPSVSILQKQMYLELNCASGSVSFLSKPPLIPYVWIKLTNPRYYHKTKALVRNDFSL